MILRCRLDRNMCSYYPKLCKLIQPSRICPTFLLKDKVDVCYHIMKLPTVAMRQKSFNGSRSPWQLLVRSAYACQLGNHSPRQEGGYPRYDTRVLILVSVPGAFPRRACAGGGGSGGVRLA